MPFGRLHEEAAGDSKLLALSNAAWRMWGMGLIYCQKNLTDGFIPESAIHLWGVRGNKALIARELCGPQVPGKAALWQRVDGGFQVHDYLQWNDPKKEVLRKRAEAKTRIDKWREHHLKDVVQNASRNALRNDVLNDVQNAHDVVRGSGSLSGGESERGEPSDSPAERVFEAFRAHWKRLYSYECSVIVKPLDFSDLQQQLAAHSEARLLTAMAAYFAADDPYIRKAKHPLPLFLRDPLKYLAKVTDRSNEPRSAVPGADATAEYLRNLRAGSAK